MTKTFLLTCVLTAAFPTPLSASTNSEIDLLVGSYTLVRADAGNCPAAITVKRETFHDSPGIGIYGNMPGEVVMQASDLGQRKFEWQFNPMTGLPDGYVTSEAKIGNGELESTFENHTTFGTRRFIDLFAARYSADTLEFSRAYDGGSFNGISFKQACAYSKVK